MTRETDQSPPWPGAAQAWWSVAVLTIAYVVSFIDRTLISLLTEAIRHDLELSDTQLSLLQGAAFAIFYGLMGLPLGWLIDRAPRRQIIMLGVTVWCLATAACGLAQNFIHLFLARMGVGAGEATLSPGAYSIISDSFRPQHRALPLAVYSAAVSTGAGLALIVGGAAAAFIAQSPPMHWPLLGVVKSWQATFILVGLGGLICVLLLASVREPARRPESGSGPLYRMPSLLARIKAHPDFFVPVLAAAGAFTCQTYAILSWLPTFFIRVHGWSVLETGARYGLILLICGPLGAAAGGWLAGRLKRGGLASADLVVTACAMPASALATAAAVLSGRIELAVAALALATFCANMPAGPLIASIQAAVSSRLRGRIGALFHLVAGMMGLFLGPVTVAVLTDYVFKNPMALGASLAVAVLGFGLSAGVLAMASIAGWKRLSD